MPTRSTQLIPTVPPASPHPTTKEIKFSEYKKVPILLVEGGDGAPSRQLNDSTAIISSVADAKGVAESAEEQQWRSWVDDTLVHLLPANIYRSPGEALASFDYLLSQSFDFSTVQKHMARYVGASVMYLLCRFKLNKKYGITEPRAQLYAAADEWTAALGGEGGGGREGGEGRARVRERGCIFGLRQRVSPSPPPTPDRDFLSGSATPGVADVTVFGALRSLEGLNTFRDLMAHSKVGPWYERMRQAVGPAKGRYVKADTVQH